MHESLENICPFEVVMYGMAREGQWLAHQGFYVEDCVWEPEFISSDELFDPQSAASGITENPLPADRVIVAE